MAGKKKAESSGKAKAEGASRVNCRYATEEDAQKVIDAYFAECDKRGKLYGEAGLALALDVNIDTMSRWWKGTQSPHLQRVIERAYLRIQEQIESDPAYMDKTLASRAIFLLKQERLGGKRDQIESSSEVTVNVKMGAGVDKSDWA